MSSLQLGLLIAGIIVVVVIVAYNALSQKGARRAAANAPAGAGVAHDGTRVEPTLNGLAGTLRGGLPELHLDGLLDCIVAIGLPRETVSGDAVLAAIPASKRVGTRMFTVEAQTPAATWEAPRAGQVYRGVQAGVPLASRNGPLNEIEYSEFMAKVEHVAEGLGGTAEFPEMTDEIARARELDAFASAHDARLRIYVCARTEAGWPGNAALQQALALGWQQTARASWLVLPGAAGPILHMQLVAADGNDAVDADPRALALGFDASQVAAGDQPFARLREMAAGLAQALDGVVTDDQGHVLGDPALNTIAEELQTLYTALDEHGFSAGSPQAQRLFS